MVITAYIRQRLLPQLGGLGLTAVQQKLVCEDVERRLVSLLSHWYDPAFRDTLLVLGAEEGEFFEPRTAPPNIRALVVVAIRNSLLEELNTTSPYKSVFKTNRHALADSRVPAFTSAAIEYFQAADLDAISVPQLDRNDPFGVLPGRYPHAWYALSMIAPSRPIESEIEPIGAPPPKLSPSLRLEGSSAGSVVQSGIDPRFDAQLLAHLSAIARGELDLFFSDSFKTISRHPEKVLHVIDFVLAHGAAVVTHNYYLSASCVARRIPLIRPFHNASEMTAKLSNTVGLTARHKLALQHIRELYVGR